MFMTSTYNLGSNPGPLPYIKRTHTFGAIKLMARYRKEIHIQITDPSGNPIIISLPVVTFAEATIPNQGEDTDSIINARFEATVGSGGWTIGIDQP